MLPQVKLKPGKDWPVRAGHPWVFSGAIAGLDAALAPGTVVEIRDAEDAFIGIGYLNPRCAIAVRVLTRANEAIDAAFVEARMARALDWRRRCIESDTNAFRLINGEGDGLPGIVVDVYGDFAVLQALTAGAETLKPWLLDGLHRHVALRGIIERSTGSVRREEGLGPIDAVAWGEAPPDVVEIREGGHRFLVDLRGGQKTGFFLDQRPNRALAQRLSRGARVLNAFAYTGSFSVYAAAGGAERIVSVDSSAAGLALAARNWALAELPAAPARFELADVFSYLRGSADAFDLLVLDPPALVKHRKDVQQGTRAYKDLHLQAFRRAAPGALAMTFTCSQHVDAALFRKIVISAAADARRDVQLLQPLGPGPDHPTALAHVEGEYLHGLLLRVGN